MYDCYRMKTKFHIQSCTFYFSKLMGRTLFVNNIHGFRKITVKNQWKCVDKKIKDSWWTSLIHLSVGHVFRLEHFVARTKWLDDAALNFADCESADRTQVTQVRLAVLFMALSWVEQRLVKFERLDFCRCMSQNIWHKGTKEIQRIATKQKQMRELWK